METFEKRSLELLKHDFDSKIGTFQRITLLKKGIYPTFEASYFECWIIIINLKSKLNVYSNFDDKIMCVTLHQHLRSVAYIQSCHQDVSSATSDTNNNDITIKNIYNLYYLLLIWVLLTPTGRCRRRNQLVIRLVCWWQNVRNNMIGSARISHS